MTPNYCFPILFPNKSVYYRYASSSDTQLMKYTWCYKSITKDCEFTKFICRSCSFFENPRNIKFYIIPYVILKISTTNCNCSFLLLPDFDFCRSVVVCILFWVFVFQLLFSLILKNTSLPLALSL